MSPLAPAEEERARMRLPVALAMAGPPCADCKHWHPVALTDPHGEYSGVRLCHADHQQHDFSCYVLAPGKRGP